MPASEITLSHKQLRSHVADRLRAAILDGELKPGDWLRQERLAQEIGVSQMPVREALKELAAEGLVEHVPYRGARVVKFSAEDIADIYAHRAFLEGRSASLAALAITKAELDELSRLQQRIERRMAPEHLAEYRELNRSFHRLIFTASRRTYLVHALNQIWAAFPSMLLSNFARTARQPLPERDEQDILEHRAIIQALRERNSEEAERLVREHILESGRKFLAALED